MTTPFGRRVSAVLSRRLVGRYVVLGIGEEAAVAEPGQFYMLAAVEEWGGGASERPFLPRALSALSGADGRLGFLLEDVGPGTHRLCQLEPGEEVYLVGPLGCGFAPPSDREAVLVGGGVGVPPLALYQERYGGQALIGFRDRHHAEAANLFGRAIVATDDGSQGHHGFVSDLLLDRLTEHDAVEILSCGPPAMLEAVGALARSRSIPAQLALEAPMACGFGACFGCVVQTRDGYKRVCLDGPVFEAAALA